MVRVGVNCAARTSLSSAISSQDPFLRSFPRALAGVAPDDTVPGQLNLFEMAPNGQVIRGVAAIPTRDQEYP